LHSRPVDGVRLKFSTCYDTMLWPVDVVEAQWTSPDRLDPPVSASDAVAALRLELRCLPDVSWKGLDADALQFHINAESVLAHTLYELLLNNCRGILVRNRARGKKSRTVRLAPDALRPMGFTEEEAMLPYPGRSFRGYRLLQEYFAFPEKFLFLELRGLGEIWADGFEDSAEIIFLISRFERQDRQQLIESGLSEESFLLGCSPVVNLFQQTAEPILLHHHRTSYPVVPDVRRRNAMEVFSVDEVVSVKPESREALRFEPFFRYRHGAKTNGNQAYWYITRRPSEKVDDGGSEVDITLTGGSGMPARPNVETVTVRLTCTNRDLPSRVRFDLASGDFELEGVPMVNRISSLRQPTETHRA
ncbi:MAG: type VI secretion system baseplate subunit TssF, partial [bacterium]|nr:type VI secretion system baseplate subunit TssF [bacterium]